jgi:glycosyltransferase involved in cell wall biosynthesis
MDLICYSHLRWNFVYQRPQHLLSRMAAHFRVFYIEEPIFGTEENTLEHYRDSDQVWIVIPHLRSGLNGAETAAEQGRLLKGFFKYFDVSSYIAWYYTPMALDIDFGITASLVVYDCMDELSAFRNAPEALKAQETSMFNGADIVFTGGASLYDAKKNRHHSIYLFPSSIDREHFKKARTAIEEPPDQQNIPHPRIGFFGVVDERMDTTLLSQAALQKPGWHFIVIGPVVKVEIDSLPKAPNIHWLGKKEYQELPDYIAGWEVAMMPFAINESTRFISPTKTPEYLAAGKPVVSTPVKDVSSYGNAGLVYIADTPDSFTEAIGKAIDLPDKSSWLKAVDAALAQNSWDITAEKMLYLINMALNDKKLTSTNNHKKEDTYV